MCRAVPPESNEESVAKYPICNIRSWLITRSVILMI